MSYLLVRKQALTDADQLVDLFQRQLQLEELLIKNGEIEEFDYEPLMGYTSFVDVEEYGRRGIDSGNVSKQLDMISQAVKKWEMNELRVLMDNLKFSEYLRLIEEVESVEEEMKRKLIKRMIMEQVGSIVRPVRNDLGVKEKEVNLMILLMD